METAAETGTETQTAEELRTAICSMAGMGIHDAAGRAYFMSAVDALLAVERAQLETQLTELTRNLNACRLALEAENRENRELKERVAELEHDAETLEEKVNEDLERTYRVHTKSNRLESELTALRVRSQWISVDERLPDVAGREYMKVLVYCHTVSGRFLDTANYHPGMFDFGDNDYLLGPEFRDGEFRVTHWIPLPEPPSVAEWEAQKQSEPQPQGKTMGTIPDQNIFGNTPDDAFGQTMRANPNGCGCRACNPKAAWLVTCDNCGNKRCPHATNHEFACTDSNEPGQKGSEWEHYSSSLTNTLEEPPSLDCSGLPRESATCAERGKHEIYLRSDGSHVCRQCGRKLKHATDEEQENV